VAPETARVIDTIATSVADGASIDWERDSRSVPDRDRRLLSHLRIVDAVSKVYRSLPASDPGTNDDERQASADPEGPRWGRLILLDRVGRGASADVFRAWDGDLEREVALKLLVDDGAADGATNARLLREARRLARVRHEHVVHVYGAERHGGGIGLWMELVRGQTLAEIVERDGPFAPREAAAAAADICGAVAAVHAAGLLHRDVKAQNVVRDENGRLVLMDFGAGAEIGSRPSVAGTPIYLAPEILAGSPATVASDVYSLGVLLFFLLSGRYPVEGASLEALLDAHRARNRTAVTEVAPSVPPALARVVDRALQPIPGERFAGAAQMEAALRAFVDPARPRPTSSWRTWTAVVATAAAVAWLVSTVANRTPGASAAAPLASIAVLPLAAASGAEAPLIADGLTDELITKLGQVQSLRVTAHTSVRRFKATNRSISDIASELHVGSVLEGTVKIDSAPDQRIHVNLRLIRAGTDLNLWSQSFDRPLADLVAVESEIARAVAHAVGAALTTSESARLSRAAQHDPRAEQAYLRARSYLAQNRQGGELQPALDALNEAVSLEPGFAAPHAALARVYVTLGFDEVMPQNEAYAVAKREARRALDLNPGLADAHIALADISFYYEWDWAGARAEYEQAIALAPSDARARTQYARFLAALGRTSDATAEARRAAAADPLSADAMLTVGLMSFYERRYDEAANMLQEALKMDPRYPGAWLTLGRIEEARRNYGEAGRFMDRALAATPIASWRADRIRVRALAGDAITARRQLQQLERELAAQNLGLDDPHRAYIFIALGEIDRGLDVLSDAVTARDPSVLWMAVDPRLDSVRRNTRFLGIVARLGRP
jgi:serine/threonine-protein kinase